MIKHVAVIGGAGKMGYRHHCTLNRMMISHDVLDTKNGTYSIDDNKYSHYIIATPSNTHADVYRDLRSFSSKPVFIEKPVVIQSSDKDILWDKTVFHGTIRRFDPMVETLTQWCKQNTVKYITIYKTSPRPENEKTYGNVVMDLAIHHVDMLLQIYPGLTFDKTKNGIIFGYGDIDTTMYVSYNDENVKEDIVKVYSRWNDVLTVSFNKHTVHNGKLEKYNYYKPLENELYAFLNDQSNNARQAHEICMDLGML